MSSPDTSPHSNQGAWIAAAGLLGVAAVILGALGAHGSLADHLIARNSQDIWRTAVLYHLVHSAMILLWSFRPAVITSNLPSILFLVGTLLFSGSLYLLASLEAKALGPVTPLGGLFLIAGWLTITICGWKISVRKSV